MCQLILLQGHQGQQPSTRPAGVPGSRTLDCHQPVESPRDRLLMGIVVSLVPWTEPHSATLHLLSTRHVEQELHDKVAESRHVMDSPRL